MLVATQNDDWDLQNVGCACHEKLQLILWNRHNSIAPATQNDFRHVIKQVAAPARQNDMTICLETFDKERFCSFPHKATGKPETRDETRGSTKTSISCETSSKFDTL